MSYPLADFDKLSLAILKACGVADTHDIQAITYTHEVGGHPTLTVRYVSVPSWETFTFDGTELRSTVVQFVPKVDP